MRGLFRSRLALPLAAFFMIATAIAIPLSGNITRSHAASDRTVTVMTQNMDEGTDFGPIFTATTLSGFEAAVGATYNEVKAGNIPERAVAIANEIAQDEPVLVGLQEASQWLTGPLGSPPAKTVVFDQLQSLLDALAQQGLHYAPIGISKNIDVEAPSNLGFDVRFIDRDVLLVRTDLADLTLSNIQVQHFANLLVLHTLTGAVTIPRGWISVDVTIKDHHTFRFLTTHLESLSSVVQVAQGNELVQGPGNTSLPVVFAGDFNSNAGSNAGSGKNQTPTYGNLIAAGFVDAWSVTNPDDPGYTWPLHLEDPLTASATPVDRIDLVLLLNKIRAKDAELVGNEPADLTPSGLWPSDHAGVVATVRI